MGAYDFFVNFDSNILSFNAYSLTAALGIGPIEIVDTSLPGVIELLANSLLSSAELATLQTTSPLPLATLSFTGINYGTSLLSFSPFFLVDGANPPNWLTVDEAQTASITVSAPIPEPSTLLLLGSGLLGFTGLRRRIGSSIRKRFNRR